MGLCPGSGSGELVVMGERVLHRIGPLWSSHCQALIVMFLSKPWTKSRTESLPTKKCGLCKTQEKGGRAEMCSGVNWAALGVWLVGNGWRGSWSEGSSQGGEH